MYRNERRAMADYKDTMILPKTDFPMRGNLPENEPKRLEKWQEMDLYGKVLEKNRDGKPFVLHDGPPYANGPIHIGHAFNKILKDFVVKSHAQRGYFTPYVPGWDCHGQPIEHMVEKTLGPQGMAETTLPELREKCREWATKYVDIQREGFKRLGVNADWDHPYHLHARLRGRQRRAVQGPVPERLHLSRPQAHPLVHALPHRARRGWHRVRR